MMMRYYGGGIGHDFEIIHADDDIIDEVPEEPNTNTLEAQQEADDDEELDSDSDESDLDSGSDDDGYAEW